MQRNNLCPNVDECVDEDRFNNRYQCVPCPKLITVFNLHEKILLDMKIIDKDVMDAIRSQTPKQLKTLRKRQSEARVEHSISEDLTTAKLSNAHFACAKDTDHFAIMLVKEYKYRAVGHVMQAAGDTVAYKTAGQNGFFFSGVVPRDFNVTRLVLPQLLESIKNDAFIEDTLTETENEQTLLELYWDSYIKLYVIIFVSFLTFTALVGAFGYYLSIYSLFGKHTTQKREFLK